MERKSHIKSIHRQTDNRFLNMYQLKFEDREGKDRDYFFCTRNSDDKLKVRTHDLVSEGICIYAVTKEEHPRLVVEREYRFPVDEMIYQLPAGLIDPGETPGEAAVREMKEETGITFEEYSGGEAFCRRPFFLVPGFSDEPGSAVFGYVTDIGERALESSEWIEVILADKAEVRRILSEEKLSVRAAFLMMQYLAMPDDEPFRFLDCRP
ncbi:MAG: NUDIX hydrolase [Lachnospiraceae bacterium]|nr:NUDIX hydrolase [Lachnospiraceae bacterium]